jgi:hypothetical protein
MAKKETTKEKKPTMALARVKKQPPAKQEVLPPETKAQSILRHPEDEERLTHIKLFIERGLVNTRKLTVADTFNSVTTGMALRAAKELIRKGGYEKWVEAEFPDFSERQAQYYGKLADVFLRETGGKLMLPPAGEYGAFLMRADSESGQLAEAIKSFVGNMNMAEILDKYHIKPKKAKGGFRPGNYMVARYQSEHPHLQNKPVDVWPEGDKAEFMKWSEKEISDNEAIGKINAAEGVWTNIRQSLVEHGLKRGTYALLTKRGLEDVLEALTSVSKKIKDAISKAGKENHG